jgi:hypothetical protein
VRTIHRYNYVRKLIPALNIITMNTKKNVLALPKDMDQKIALIRVVVPEGTLLNNCNLEISISHLSSKDLIIEEVKVIKQPLSSSYNSKSRK